ncbi:MAG TPA: Tad domain-containing protein [Blastocatellia bacterium]|nr:Tad domain-containing protein [Blastocatellia bacterium]
MPRNAISHRRSERGNVLILTAATLLVMMGITALAIDLGYLLNGKAELQNALDSAALAAVTQTHVVIALNPLQVNYDQKQIELIKQYAEKFVETNEIRANKSGSNRITLNLNNDIDLSNRNTELPRIAITHSVALPTFFAGIMGFDGIGVSARAEARLIAVDGGTGTISGGAVLVDAQGNSSDVVTGGWRPLLIPDTYFDPGGNVRRLVIEIINGQPTIREPQDGSWYRSRFAGSNATNPFVDRWQAASPATPGLPTQPDVTSLRDVFYNVDALNNLLGTVVNFNGRLGDYRIVDFSGSQDPIEAASQAFYGYTGRVRVGDQVRVLPTTGNDPVFYRLRDLRNFAITTPYDGDVGGALLKYGYVSTKCSGCRFSTPNTHPLIIPVLLCNPFEFYRRYKGYDPDDTKPFTVTNLGVLFIETAGFDGDIQGRFIREVITGGTQITPNSIPQAQLRLLPVSAKIVRQ